MRTKQQRLYWSTHFAIVGLLAACAHAQATHRVHVVVLHSESSIRTSLANRDAYIVRIESKSGKAFTARIVDQYPGCAEAPALLPGNENIHYSVSLRRAPYCDGMTNGTEMECFEVVHDSWRIPKTSEDQWWK